MIAFKKLLFPTDFSANADRALAHALRLANFDNGEVIVQHVVADYFEKHPHWATLFDLHEMQKYLDCYVDVHMKKIMASETDNVKFRTVISKGKPAEEIAGLAERELVDLVVMGSAKGVVTNKVIRITNRPVMAVSANQPSAEEVGLHHERSECKPDRAQPSRKINKILVATDFSAHSKRIVEYAFDLKRVFNATIYMLYVVETSHAVEWAIRQGHFIHAMDKMREWAGNQLLNLTPDEFINDPNVIRLIESGSPGDVIADVAFEVGADLTILGTHEYGTVHKHLIGTTTDKLLTKTSTPVLTVKL